jgi:hypothetical protein
VRADIHEKIGSFLHQLIGRSNIGHRLLEVPARPAETRFNCGHSAFAKHLEHFFLVGLA